MEILGIYGFHFLDGVGRVIRYVRDENIQRVQMLVIVLSF